MTIKPEIIKSKLRVFFNDRKKAVVVMSCATIILVATLCFALSTSNPTNAIHDNKDADAPVLAHNNSSVFESNGDETNPGNGTDKSKMTDMDNLTHETQDSTNNSNVTALMDNGKYISCNGETSDKQSNPAKERSDSMQPGNPQKTWVEDVEKVWIVDKAAWIETIPVYENVERSICNVCGADITGNTSEHSKQHMLNGEGSGYHSEVQRMQTGEQSVEHPEEGHWKTVVVGGHWE